MRSLVVISVLCAAVVGSAGGLAPNTDDTALSTSSSEWWRPIANAIWTSDDMNQHRAAFPPSSVLVDGILSFVSVLAGTYCVTHSHM
jgi:hypothetical protein